MMQPYFPGMLGMGIGVIVFQLISTIGMGYTALTIYCGRVLFGKKAR